MIALPPEATKERSNAGNRGCVRRKTAARADRSLFSRRAAFAVVRAVL